MSQNNRNPNEKKKFTDQFRNANGSYHIPTWLIVVLFILDCWPIALCLLIARLCEDKSSPAAHPQESPNSDTGCESKPTGQGTGSSTDMRDVQGQYASGGGATQASQEQRVYVNATPGKKKNAKKKIGTQKLWLILGVVLCLFSVSELPDSIQYLVWCIRENTGISYAVRDVVQDSLWLIGGIVMLLVSASMRASAKKRKRVAAIVGNSNYILIDEVAEALSMSRRKTERILQRCIDCGMFGEKAYLDMRSDCLVIRGATPMSKKARAEAEAAERAAEEATDNLDEYEKTLQELRELNNRIPGEEMSAKISRMEDLTAKIFKLAKEQPEKLGSMRKFMDYYLPTSLKLLARYEKLDAQGVEGTNIRASKRQIEETMDTMITAFEKQLDKLFLSESIDISADIAAMQNLMRADGLMENEIFDKLQ